jgi:hypothetical protein
VPAGVFDDPAFADALFGDDGDEAVSRLWQSLASEVEADPPGAAGRWRMPPAEARRLPTGLDVAGEAPRVASVGAHAAGRYAVVRLGRPVSSPEAAFAAVLLGDDAPEPRFFVWEFTRSRHGGSGDAILCEWLPDGSRRNHGRTGSVEGETAFVGALTRQLDGEAERVRAGAPAIAAPTRRPGEAVDPLDFMLSAAEQASFRQQHCMMAFNVLPNAVAGEPRRWAGATESASLGPLLEALWREAGEAAAKVGHLGDVPSEGLAGGAARIAGRPCALITFPKPLSPPEAYFAVVFPEGLGTHGGGEGPAPVVYTLEMADAFGELPPVVARIDPGGMHAIAGECGGATLAEFEKALEAVAAGRRLPDTGTVIRQLLLYAQVGSPGKSAAGSLSG